MTEPAPVRQTRGGPGTVTLRDSLRAAWGALGVGWFGEPACATPRLSGPGSSAESLAGLLVATAGAAREDPRLTWTTAAWLATHAALLDAAALARTLAPLDAALEAAAQAHVSAPRCGAAAARQPPAATRRNLGVVAAIAGVLDSTVIGPRGVLRAAATPRPGWASVLAGGERAAFFHVVDAHPVLRELAIAEARPDVASWGYWMDTITDSRDAIRPRRWVLAHHPSLRPGRPPFAGRRTVRRDGGGS